VLCEVCEEGYRYDPLFEYGCKPDDWEDCDLDNGFVQNVETGRCERHYDCLVPRELSDVDDQTRPR